MSKTIESFKKISAKGDLLHEHIADTYFSRKIHKKKVKPTTEQIRLIYTVSSLVAAAFFLVLAFSLVHNHYIKFLKQKTANSKVINIFDRGQINKQIIKNFEFRGYAKGKSKFSNKLIVLNTPKKYNWADLSLDFKFPVDLTNKTLSLTLKGEIGGETVNLILRDADNRTYRLGDIYLTSDWKNEIITLNDIKKDIDISKITHLRFEYGQVGESSKKMDSLIDLTIYIKTIKISKEA